MELKMIAQYLMIWIVLTYTGIFLAYRKSKRVERELRAEPFVPAYSYSPPQRRRTD